MSHIISIEEFRRIQHDDDVMIFDATFVLPTMNRNAPVEYEQIHIPRAQFFDIDKIADTSSDLPHMIPTADEFTKMMRALGVCQHHKIICYDNSPFLSAARAWWLFRLFGKENVFVLDGGLPAYVSAGGAVSHGTAQDWPIGDFTAVSLHSSPLASVMLFAELRAQIEAGADIQIIDARPTGRFEGAVAEPRAGLRSGHIKGALNLPVTELIDKQTGRLQSLTNLKALFIAAGLDFDKPAITSCGSGVTAAGLTLALAQLGKYDVALYDGSWAEWGASDAPIFCPHKA